LTSYLVLVIPIVLGWLIKQSNLATRAFASVTLATSVLAQVAAYTRAGWVAHFTQAVAFVVIVRRQQLVIWLLIGAILIGGALFGLSSIGYQQETADPWTFSARMKTWHLGVQQVLAHPIVGVGFGNNTFSKVYAAEIEADKDKGPVEKVLPALHNTFAMVLMGSGVPGLTLFIWIMARAIRELLAGVQVINFSEDGNMVLRTAIALAVIGFLVRNLFDYMFAGSLASLFWILVAVGFSSNDDHRRNESRKSDHDVYGGLSPAN
jgi:putative inorganic carbon (HCO3(-)) transporter